MCFFNLTLSQEEIQHIGQQIENLIHGRSSGIDISLSLLGGMVIYNNNEATHNQYQNNIFTIVNTGKSESTTAECVDSVIQQLTNSALLHEMTKNQQLISFNVLNQIII